ncbi:MAG: hypothetical protein RL757_1370 [Bacteroidota bacterium]|jgi:hypothetical protein
MIIKIFIIKKERAKCENRRKLAAELVLEINLVL